MPSIFTHAVVPLATGLGLGSSRISHRLLLAGVAASIAPDLDVLALRFVQYSHEFGHRGASHSFVAAGVLGLVAMLFASKLHCSRRAAFLFVAFSAASHGLLDMLTNGGGGIAVLWPFTDERLVFFDHQVIQVSPLSVRRFFGPDGLEVIRTELLWVWAPAIVCAAVVRTVLSGRLQRRQQSHTG